MVLFNLLAKLSLDKTAFDKDLEQAEKDGKNFDAPGKKKLELDATDYKKGIAEAEESSKKFQGIWQDIIVAIGTAAISATIQSVIKTLETAVNVYLELSDTIDAQAHKMKISAQAYQEWDHVLSRSRADMSDLKDGVEAFNSMKAAGEVPEDLADAFEKLGISATDSSGKIKNTEALLKETILHLARYKGDDRGTIAEAIFGKNAGNLEYLFDQGSMEIRNLIDEAHELGIVLSDEQVDAGVQFKNSLDNLHDQIEAFQSGIAKTILPILQGVVDGISTIMSQLTGADGGESLEKSLNGVKEGLIGEAREADRTAEKATGLLEKLWSMGNAAELTATQFGVWKATAEELKTLIPELDTVINTDTGEITANKDEIIKMIDAWRDYRKEKALATAMEEQEEIVRDWQAKYFSARANQYSIEEDTKLARQESRAGLNAWLQKRGIGVQIGEDATFADVEKMFEGNRVRVQDENGLWGSKSLFGSATAAQTAEWDTYWNNWKKAEEELNKATTKADDLQAQMEQAEANADKYEEALRRAAFGVGEDADSATTEVNELNDALESLPSEKTVSVVIGGAEGILSGFHHAKGNDYVPYDNYPAILHRGEAVLTASQARKYREGGNVDLSGLEDRIEAAIRRGMEGAQVNSYLNGRNVTDEVARQMANDLAARRFG